MRRQLLRIALGLGLAVSSVGPIYAQAGEPGTPTRPSGEGSDQPRPQSSPGTTQNPSSPAAGGGGTMMDMGIAMGDDLTTRPMTQAEMTAAAKAFWADAEQNWSTWGFSSAPQARVTLGGDWWMMASKMAGLSL
jgi:hypothetical protein